MERWEFDLLGIPVTQDKKEIKKAYAKQVKKYHPEDSPREWEQLHKAYKAALNYAENAQMYEEDTRIYEENTDEFPSHERRQEFTEPDREETDADLEKNPTEEGEEEYGESVFNEIDIIEELKEKHREEIQALKEQVIRLCGLKGEEAWIQWKRFLQSREMREVPIEVLQLILRQVLDNKLEKRVLKLLSEVMKNREQEYFMDMRLTEARLAGEIAELSAKGRLARIGYRGRDDRVQRVCILGIFGVFMVFFLIACIGDTRSRNSELGELHLNSTEARYMREEIAEYMNQKYQEDYDSSDFVIYQWEEKWVAEKKFDWYLAQAEDDRTVKVCIYKNAEEMTFFDTVQMGKISGDLREETRSLTGGYASMIATTMRCANTYYEGDLEEFFEKERKINCQLAGTTDVERETITVFAVDPNCSTMEERWSLETAKQKPEWEEGLIRLEDITRQNIVGITMVKEYVTYYLEKTNKNESDWFDTHIWTRDHSPILEPFITSLYVSPSMEDDRKLKDGDNCGMIESYPRDVVKAGEGIYAFQREVIRNEEDVSDNTAVYHDYEMELNVIDLPEGAQLTEAEKKKSISFQPEDHLKEENEWFFVIDKKQYGIADSEYKVVDTTELGEEDMEQMYVDISYEDAGDYLVVMVPISHSAVSSKARNFTVVNP